MIVCTIPFFPFSLPRYSGGGLGWGFTQDALVAPHPYITVGHPNNSAETHLTTA
jgi:hypothetical protein